MPELPEVETMRRGVLPVVGARIESVQLVPCRRRPISISHSVATLRRRLVGTKIQAVERIGKKVVVINDSQIRLVFEPRMTGLVLTSKPPTNEHLRFRLGLQGKSVRELLYWDRRGLGLIYCLNEEEFVSQLQRWNLGPDACDISCSEFSDRLGQTKRPIKVALLDQSLLAGVGNLYASEILHRAKISPLRPALALNARAWKRVHQVLREVLDEAIEYEGSTLADGTYRNALNQAGCYQNEHRVYDREGERCPSCRLGTIIRIVQAQRATFFCPKCQSR